MSVSDGTVTLVAKTQTTIEKALEKVIATDYFSVIFMKPNYNRMQSMLYYGFSVILIQYLHRLTFLLGVKSKLGRCIRESSHQSKSMVHSLSLMVVSKACFIFLSSHTIR